jgi:hypothetical protein
MASLDPTPDCGRRAGLDLSDLEKVRRTYREPAARHREVWRHLRDCPLCREAWSRTVDRLLKEDPAFRREIDRSANAALDSELVARLRALPAAVWERAVPEDELRAAAGRVSGRVLRRVAVERLQERLAELGRRCRAGLGAGVWNLTDLVLRTAAGALLEPGPLLAGSAGVLATRGFPMSTSDPASAAKDSLRPLSREALRPGARGGGASAAGYGRRIGPLVTPPQSDQSLDCLSCGHVNHVQAKVLARLPWTRLPGRDTAAAALGCRVCREPMLVALDVLLPGGEGALASEEEVATRLEELAEPDLRSFTAWAEDFLESLESHAAAVSGREPEGPGTVGAGGPRSVRFQCFWCGAVVDAALELGQEASERRERCRAGAEPFPALVTCTSCQRGGRATGARQVVVLDARVDAPEGVVRAIPFVQLDS